MAVCGKCGSTENVRVLGRMLHEGVCIGTIDCCTKCWPKPMTIKGDFAIVFCNDEETNGNCETAG